MQKTLNRKLITQICLTVLALIGFLLIAILVMRGYNFKIDQFNISLANNRNNFWNGFFKIFTHIGALPIVAGISLLAVILIWFVMKNKRMSAFYAVCFACVCLANFILKKIVKRVRPEHLMLVEETGFSFPSGHAMLIFAFGALAIHFIWKTIQNKPLKIALISIVSALIGLVGFSRIYLGVHYLTDIIAGFLCSFVIVMAFIMLYNTKLFKFLKDKEKTNEE